MRRRGSVEAFSVILKSLVHNNVEDAGVRAAAGAGGVEEEREARHRQVLHRALVPAAGPPRLGRSRRVRVAAGDGQVTNHSTPRIT